MSVKILSTIRHNSRNRLYSKSTISQSSGVRGLQLTDSHSHDLSIVAQVSSTSSTVDEFCWQRYIDLPWRNFLEFGAKCQREVPLFLEVPCLQNFFIAQCMVSGKSPHARNQLDWSVDTIPSYDRRTDGQMTTAYTALAQRCAVKIEYAYDMRNSDVCVLQ